MVRGGVLVSVQGWVRRTYDDRRYADGARHAVVAGDETTVLTACGRTMERVTAARVANRLIPSPAGLVRSDTRTCGHCSAATA